MILQVIDAMGDKGDCQREHQYCKRAAAGGNELRNFVLGNCVIFRTAKPEVLKLPNYKITQLQNFYLSFSPSLNMYLMAGL